jgi:SAM-dependent methyltransferase
MTEEILTCPVCEKDRFSLFLKVEDYFLTREDFSIQQCDACGFRFINPRPAITEIGSYYQSDEYISHDAKKADFLSRIYKIARVFSIKSKYKIVSKHAKTGKILDIGCGTGEFLNFCKSKGFEIAGVEPNEKARSHASQVNQVTVHEKLTDLAITTGRFNCITMWHVLEHVHDLNETIELVKRLLAPGGIFIVAVPNSNSWDAKKYGRFWAAYDVPRHLYHFFSGTMNRLVTKHGFEIIVTLPQRLDAYYVSMLSEKYKSGSNNYPKALFNGFWSNLVAGNGQLGHSSLIFILSVKKS